mmetsp:Transcript_49933/g.109057  ORF Transcript_49933/g.109057 Transcript_49933/m.109057 type:complete len:222 (+) Transcript_49933:1446-2111(+)
MDSVHGCHTIRPSAQAALCNQCNLGNVASQFGEHGHHRPVLPDACLLAPSRNLLHNSRILAASQSHSSFPHAVRARQIQLHNVGTGVNTFLADFLPIFLDVADHHRRHNHPVREISLQLMNGLAPICGSLLSDQFNVQKARLVRAILVRVGPAHDPRRHVGHQVFIQRECLGHSETPPCLECSANHGSRRAARGACKTKRIGEPYTGHSHRHINVIDGSVK